MSTTIRSMAPNSWLPESGIFFLPPPLIKTPEFLLLILAVLLSLALLVSGRFIDRRRQTKLGGDGVSTSPSAPHLLQFPPSRRHVLASLSGFEKFRRDGEEISPETLRARALSTTTTTAADLDKDDLYTPTGFLTQEIRALGRFPDYGLLSGVRPPVPVAADWDISKAVFRPYRPLRWGYHQHMALMKFDPDNWVELEQNYAKTMAARQALLKEHKSRIFFQSPSAASALAARELSEMLLQFLIQRYPAHFALSRDKTLFINHLLRKTTNLLTTPPLQTLFDNIPEDYAIMLRDESTGCYRLRAAMVCSSVGWHIAQHADSPLSKIHTEVPDAGKMAFSMDRFFSKMPTDSPVNRCSWSLEDWEAMFTTPDIEPEGWSRSAFAGNPGDLKVGDIRLRCDAQTLRRLPLSGAIVFNFKAIFTPLVELRDEAFVPALMAKVLREGKQNLMEYKCVEHVRRVAMEACEGWAEEQVERGVVTRGWEVGTLDESPFFPGWEEKWRRQQQ